MEAFLNQAGHKNHEFILVTQSQRGLFNKGVLFNLGAHFAERRGCDYVALHDIDHVPLHPNNTYGWPQRPIHLCTNTEDVECCFTFAGGAVLMQLRHFAAINGFSNQYYGWGGDDADLYYLVTRIWSEFDRLDPSVGRYQAASHGKNDNRTQHGSHADNLRVLTRFRQSRGRAGFHADGYHSLQGYVAAVNATLDGRRLVRIVAEVLRDGARMPPC